MITENEFYEIIADLVDFYQRDRQWKRSDVAELLGVSDSYIRKIHSRGSDKKYNVKQLFLLSRKFGVSISDLFPSEENLLLIERYSHLNLEERKKILKQMENILPLRKEDAYE